MELPCDVLIIILAKYIRSHAKDRASFNLYPIMSILCALRRSKEHYDVLMKLIEPIQRYITICKEIHAWQTCADASIKRIRVSNDSVWLKCIDTKEESGGVIIKSTVDSIEFTLYSAWIGMPNHLKELLGIENDREYVRESWSDVSNLFRKQLLVCTCLSKNIRIGCAIAWFNPVARECHISKIDEKHLREDIYHVLKMARFDLERCREYFAGFRLYDV